MLYDMNKWNWLQFCVKRQSRGMSRKYQDEEITTSVVFASLWFISWAFSFAVSPEFTRSAFISSVDFRVKTRCRAVLPCHFKAPSKKHFITYNGLCWREENLFLFYSLSRDLHFSCSRLCARWAHAEIGCHFFRQWFLGNLVTALIQTSTQCGGYKTQVPMEWPAVWR